MAFTIFLSGRTFRLAKSSSWFKALEDHHSVPKDNFDSGWHPDDKDSSVDLSFAAPEDPGSLSVDVDDPDVRWLDLMPQFHCSLILLKSSQRSFEELPKEVDDATILEWIDGFSSVDGGDFSELDDEIVEEEAVEEEAQSETEHWSEEDRVIQLDQI